MADRVELPKLSSEVRGAPRRFYDYAAAELERRRAAGADLDERRYARAVRLVLERLGARPEDLR